jgi:hypothetical protein
VASQFKRFFITQTRERFGKNTVDRHGRPEIGSYRATFKYVKDIVEGRMGIDEFDKLPQHHQDAIYTYLRGAGMVLAFALIMGATDDDDVTHKVAEQAYRDANILFTPSKLKYKFQPAVTFTYRSLTSDY